MLVAFIYINSLTFPLGLGLSLVVLQIYH